MARAPEAVSLYYAVRDSEQTGQSNQMLFFEPRSVMAELKIFDNDFYALMQLITAVLAPRPRFGSFRQVAAKVFARGVSSLQGDARKEPSHRLVNIGMNLDIPQNALCAHLSYSGAHAEQLVSA